jgi:hypothetical protein
MSFGDWVYRYNFHIQAVCMALVGICVIIIVVIDAGWLGELEQKPCTAPVQAAPVAAP